MEKLLPLICSHFEGLSDRLKTFSELAFQCEGWFKGELLTLLSSPSFGYKIDYLNREVDFNGRKIDLEISIDQITHRIELKHWLIGKQKQNTWNATGYFGDRKNGILFDVEKLKGIPGGKRWLLIFTTKNPGNEDWSRGIELFNRDIAPHDIKVKSITSPNEFPISYFCGLLRIDFAGAFRVHHNKLSPGENVPPSDYFFNCQDEKKKLVEDIFEKTRPDTCLIRKNAAYLYEEKSDALNLIARRGNGYLYEVEIDLTKRFHRADWNWLGIAEREYGLLSKMEEAANNYWQGKLTDNPIIELIAEQATVVQNIKIDTTDMAKRRKSTMESHF
ncbi:MAG: hypothetical protein ACHQQQ_01125 [Bacteroidota bacterium]